MSAEEDVFAAAAARKQAIAAELAERPVQDVIGVVDASGKGGWPEDDDQWTLSFDFDRWKHPTASLKTQPLAVEFTAPKSDYDALWKCIHADSVIRIRARVVEESVVGGVPRAQLIEFLGEDSDPELNQAAADIQQSVVYEDIHFGQFVLNRRVNWYSTETVWNGKTVTLNLTPDDSGSIELALQAARTLWQDQNDWAVRIEGFAVHDLLAVKNDNWLDDDEVELTSDEFKARMTLEAITIASDGAFDFWHHDGGLFSGHSIQVCGNLSTGPTSADIPG